jgi:tripartite ATP-independent transporter DctM subunit
MYLTIFLIAFVFFFLFGMPISIAMISSAFLYIALKGMDLGFMAMQMFSGLDNFVLIAIPMFILTAEVMNKSSVADRIFNFCNALVGYIPGGLGHVNILTSVIFAGMSGSAVADVGGIGHLSYKAMVDKGYDREFSASVTISSSTVGPIIPPSIPMVVYAMVANVSVGRMFFAGIVPGLIIAGALMIYVSIVSIRRNYPLQKIESARTFARDVFFAIFRGFLPLLTPVILLGSIYMGVVTTTEASALAVLYSLILGFILYRTIGIKDFFTSLKQVFITCGSILLLLPAAKVFSFVFTAENLQDIIFRFMTDFAGDNTVLIILSVNILFIILGALSDPTVNIMLFVPMVLPLVIASGMDTIHFGIMVVVNAMIGNTTPPVGVVLMTVCGIEKLSYEKTLKELWPMIAVLLIALALIIIFPGAVLAIPNAIFAQ